MDAYDNRTRTFLFFLVPNFSMIAFATAIEPLRIANRFHSGKPYDWKLVSSDGGPVTASNGLAIDVDISLAALASLGYAVVVAMSLATRRKA